MKKTSKLLLLLFITIFVLTACQSQAAETPTAPETSGTAVLRLGTRDGSALLDLHQSVIALYEADNPDVLVQLEAVADRDYDDRLQTMFTSGAAPDIVQLADESIPEFVAQGDLVALDNYFSSTFDTAAYLPNLLEPGQVDGDQYLLPKSYSTLAIYYNKALFDAAGVPYPEDGWTWDDLLDVALDLTQDLDGDNAPDIWGLQLPATWTTGFEYWVAAAGGQLVSDNGKDFVGYMDSEAVINAVTFYADLYNKYRVSPPPTDLEATYGGNTEFVDGDAAMLLFDRSIEAELLANKDIELGVVGLPQGEERANILFWEGYGVASSSAYPRTAANFLAFYTGEAGNEVWVNTSLPTVLSVAESSGLTTDPIASVWINELNYVVPRAYTFTPYWDEAGVPALAAALQTAILEKNADIPALMTQAALDAQTALDALLGN
ncbi:MAG: sugar ABC transporter substrate-binding protein [Anaerolineaceae bacterium]|nr:sugar ABC transporter substrate-binding protein [Anaerolineaceae bacterium]